jgi:hypothetical protein
MGRHQITDWNEIVSKFWWIVVCKFNFLQDMLELIALRHDVEPKE